MRNYLIIVEGAHDIALFEKVLRINGVDRKITNENDLPMFAEISCSGLESCFGLLFIWV